MHQCKKASDRAAEGLGTTKVCWCHGDHTSILSFFSKVSAMKQFEQQHESKHDKLGSEYEALWTNVKTILEDLERHFEDRFYAKVFLSHIFMVCKS